MKLTKSISHFLIALTSVAAMLTGWASLAHSLKPIQPVDQTKYAALAPLAPVGSVDTGSAQGKAGLFSSAPRQQSMVFRTRGS